MKQKAPRAAPRSAAKITAVELRRELARLLRDRAKLSSPAAETVAAQIVRWSDNYGPWTNQAARRRQLGATRERFRAALVTLEGIRADLLEAAEAGQVETSAHLFLREWADQISRLQAWTTTGFRTEDGQSRTFEPNEFEHLDWNAWLQDTKRPAGGRPIDTPRASLEEGVGIILRGAGVRLTRSRDGLLARVIEHVFTYVGRRSGDVIRSVERAAKAS